MNEQIKDMITYMGDVHLGRRFRNGVPLHRLNERENMIWKQFEHDLLLADRPLHIQPGDIFNEFSVSEYVVWRAANAYKAAAKANPHVLYIILRGNHDAARDADKRSSFDLLKMILDDVENIVIASDPTVVFHHNMKIGLMPWHPFKSSTELAHEMIGKLHDTDWKYDAVVTHCEIKSFGGSDENLLPLNVLKHRTTLIYNGHIHQKQTYEAEGVEVIVTGSMQPYAHGEDTEGNFYKTMPLVDAVALPAEDIKDINLRVLVSDGEVVPELDVLSLVVKKVQDVAEEEQQVVQLETFDMDALFQGTLAEHKVGASVAEQIMQKFQEKKNG